MGRWPPDARDTNYRGPYPIQNLHQARGVLIYCLQNQNQDDPALQSLLRKIGIDLPNQCVIPSPLLQIVRNSSPFPIVNSHPPSNFSRITPDQDALSVHHTIPPMGTPRRAFLLEPPRPHLLFTPVKQQSHSRPIQQTSINFTPDNHLFTFGAGDNNVRMDSPMGQMHHYPNGFLGVRSHKETQSTFGIFSAEDNQTGRMFDQSNHGVDRVVSKSLTDVDSSMIRRNEHVAPIRSLHEVDISSETLKQILANKASVDEDSSLIRGCDSRATIHNVVDVNISSETLKQILASVGQTHQNHVEQQHAGPNQTLVDHKEKVAENENEVSRNTDFNGHNTLHGEIGSSREKLLAFVTPPPSETHKSKSAENNLNFERTNTRDIFSNTNSETQGVHRNNGGQTLTEHMFPMFKCDYCRFMTQYLNDMRLHLADSNHLSGSEYLAKQVKPCQSELLYTERMMAVKNPAQTRKNNTVIACPECRKTFGSIFLCSQHFKYEHKSTSGYYVICPVIHSVFIPLELSPACSACRDRFASWRALCDHWMSFPNHSPLPASSNHQIFHQFVCPTCGCTFSENFVDAVMQFEIHFQEEHNSEADFKPKLVGIETKQVMLPTRKEKQHEFNPQPKSNGIMDEICVLKQLCASGKLTSGLLAAESRINELQFQLSTS